MADTLSGSGAAVTDSITPTDPGLTDAERARLSPQCVAVLNCLRRGPAWNFELATIGLSYTRRLSDLRAHGHQVDIIQNGEHGARLYGLVITCPTCKGGDLVRCDHCNDHGALLVAAAPVPGCNLRTIHPGAPPNRDAGMPVAALRAWPRRGLAWRIPVAWLSTGAAALRPAPTEGAL